MANVERTTSWQQIQQGMKEAERLIARKEYNLVMVKARQTLEFMVRCMAERACLVEGDLSDTIDQLYEGRWIDKATKDNYHTIRILGNKAVHEGDDTAYDANQAYQLLTQEVYAFAHEFTGSKQGRSQASARSTVTRTATGRQGTSSQRSTAGSRNTQRTAARSSYSSAGRQSGAKKKKRRRVSPVFYIWRLLIPVLVVVLLIVVIRVLLPGKDAKPDTSSTPADVTTAPTEPAPTPAPEPETEPETEPLAEIYRIKGNSVNVRTEPSTDCRILAQLSNGTEVTFVKRYSNDWTVINYDGQEAYVSSQFIEKVEAEPEASPE